MFLSLFLLFAFIHSVFGDDAKQCRKDCNILDDVSSCQWLEVQKKKHGASTYFIIDGEYISLKGLHWGKEMEHVSDEWVNFKGKKFLFDTANPRSCVNEHLASLIGDKLLFNVRHVYGVLYGNLISVHFGSIATIKIGERDGVEISAPIGIGCASNQFDGFIGYDLIETFRMILDPVNGKIMMPKVPLSTNVIPKNVEGVLIPFEPLINPETLSKQYNKPIRDRRLWYDIVPYNQLMREYFYDNFFIRGIINNILSAKVAFSNDPLPAQVSSAPLSPAAIRQIAIHLLSSTRADDPDDGGFFSFYFQIAQFSEQAIAELSVARNARNQTNKVNEQNNMNRTQS